MEDKTKETQLMQKELLAFKANSSSAKLYFASMKEISLWLQTKKDQGDQK